MREDKNKFKQPSQKKKKTDEERNHYLITSEYVLDRLQWDLEWSNLLPQVIIGYLDRFLGMQEISISEFLAQSDIPMHRIYYFAIVIEKSVSVLNEEGQMAERWEEERIRFWDRETRTDHFSKKQIFSILHDRNYTSAAVSVL